MDSKESDKYIKAKADFEKWVAEHVGKGHQEYNLPVVIIKEDGIQYHLGPYWRGIELVKQRAKKIITIDIDRKGQIYEDIFREEKSLSESQKTFLKDLKRILEEFVDDNSESHKNLYEKMVARHVLKLITK